MPLTGLQLEDQVGILASFAIKPQNLNAFAAQKLFMDAASVILSLHVLEGRKDFAITMCNLQNLYKKMLMSTLMGYGRHKFIVSCIQGLLLLRISSNLFFTL